MGEKLTTDIASCIQATGTGETIAYTAKNTQGALALDLINLNKTTCLIQICSPLQSLNTMIPANTDVGFRFVLATGMNVIHTFIRFSFSCTLAVHY